MYEMNIKLYVVRSTILVQVYDFKFSDYFFKEIKVGCSE